MRYALMIEAQQGLSYAELLAIAQRAEAAGFEALFRSDHYESFPGPAGRPTTDAWTVLAGLARETTTIRLGVLVSPVTFRLPGNLAKIVATVDEMSGGRVELGIGAGWNEDEHRRHGFPFPPIKERADMLEEQLAVVHGLWEEPDGWSFEGRHYRVEDAIFYPKPVQRPRVPILVGGSGSPRSLRLAARYADEFNITSADAATVAEKMGELDAACQAIGRDPRTIRRSAMVGTMIAADPGQLAARKQALLTELTPDEAAEDWFATREQRWIFGTPDQARAKIAEFAAAGVDRLMFQDFLPRDLAMIDELGAELIGR
ncbi:MAG: LLM class F420-dependent oxidoreductase [Chloroflexota bacterium]|nr:LLM class F420-dependent oxidoreductase [Chloroflexota bacterium]